MRVAVLIVLAALSASLVWGGPTLRSVEPPGGQPGTAVRLVLEGTGLDGKILVHSEIPGSLTELSAEGQARQFLLEIDPEAAPGAYPLSVETEAGRTNRWIFGVSAFPSTREAESSRPRAPRNDSEGDAQPIETPTVVNGRLEEADRDLYRVSLGAGESIVFEVEARRLGSAVDPVLAVRAPDGSTIARNDDAPGIGSDARLAFKAGVQGEYIVEVHDARFSEQQRNFYRLVAGPLEYAEAVFPLGWKAGESVEVELSGGSLAGPKTVTVDGDRVALPGGNTGLPMPFLRSGDLETLERAGRRRTQLTEGTVVNGRIEKPGEVDRYRLKVQPGEEWMVETQAAILGTSRLYTLLIMRDRNGKRLASAGDQPPEELLSNISTRAETFGDPALGFRVPEDMEELEFTVEDLLGRGGPGFAYRLIARRQPADFIARLNETELNIPRGGTTSVSLTLDRRGYDGPVRIIAEGLPDSVVVEGGNIPAEFGGMTTQRNSLNGRLMLTAAADAEPGLATVRLYGEGRTADGQVFQRPVFTSSLVAPVAGLQQRPVRVPGETGRVQAVVAAESPASIEVLSPRSLRLIQGLKHDIRWAYRTSEPGVEALTPVLLINAPAVANLRILGDAKIKPGDSEGTLEMNTTMGTPAMRFDLVFQARVRHDGVVHTIYSRAITVDVVQGYSLGAPSETVKTDAGTEFELAGSFSREPEFDSEVIVEAANLPVGVKCDPQRIADSPDRYALRCQVGATAEPGEYLVEIAPRSVLAGRDKEAVPYNIPPVEAVLVIAGKETIAVSRPQ